MMQRSNVFLIAMMVVGTAALGWIAYQTLRAVQISNEITQLILIILKTHP